MDLSRVRAKPLIYTGALLAAAAAVSAVFRLCPLPGIFRAGEMTVISSGTISGSLDDTLKRHGLADPERYQISKAYSKALNLRRLRPEDEYAIAFSTAALFKYMFISKDLKQYYLFPSTGAAAYRLVVREVTVSTSAARVTGAISSSLWESMSAQGVPPDVILDYADVFSWSVDFLTEVRAGDKYDLVYECGAAPDGRIVSKKVLAAVYDGGETGRKMAGAWGKGYYDENAASVRSMFLRAPLHYRRISSFFTYKRFHPVLKYMRPHLGIDYAAPSGTPVSAVADGTVTYAGWKGANGRLVTLRHGAGYISTYGHLSRFAKGIRGGRRVSQGDLIGYVGSTGLSSGPHLDFRVKQNGRALNFMKIKYRSSGGLGGAEKTAYLAGLKTLLPEYFK